MVDKTQPMEAIIEKTQPMEVVEKPLTVKDVINNLVAVNSVAWMALPQNIRDALIERPHLFKFITSRNVSGYQPPPRIVYNGVVLFYDSRWVLDRIDL